MYPAYVAMPLVYVSVSSVSVSSVYVGGACGFCCFVGDTHLRNMPRYAERERRACPERERRACPERRGERRGEPRGERERRGERGMGVWCRAHEKNPRATGPWDPMLRADHFTNVSCALAALALRLGRGSWAWRLGAPLAVFVCVAFHAVLLVDPLAHARLRAARRLPARAFHAGNLALHVAPAALALARPPRGLRPAHVAAAHALFVAWAAWASRGTFRLDAVYAPLPPAAWHLAQAAGVAAMLLYLEAAG